MSYLDYLRSLTTNRKDSLNWDDLLAIVNTHTIFDKSIAAICHEDPLYIERKILNHVVKSFHIKAHFEYLTGVSGRNNAFVYKKTDGTASGLFLDEILDLSIMEAFLTVWAVVYKPEQIRFCKWKWEHLLNTIAGKETDRSDNKNVILETDMSDLSITQALDMYWSAWTFVVGHEIYHIINRDELSTREEEFQADRFGFQVLIRFIQEQKAGILPEGLDCYYEEFYLVPCMLMYFFMTLDKYRTVTIPYGNTDTHPSPEERMQHIIDLFDVDVPEDMDTTNGNAFLATFLDAVDQLNGL